MSYCALAIYFSYKIFDEVDLCNENRKLFFFLFVFSFLHVIILLIREEKYLYPFLCIFYTLRKVRFGIVKIRMEKQCRKICVTNTSKKATFKIIFQNTPVP